MEPSASKESAHRPQPGRLSALQGKRSVFGGRAEENPVPSLGLRAVLWEGSAMANSRAVLTRYWAERIVVLGSGMIKDGIRKHG